MRALFVAAVLLVTATPCSAQDMATIQAMEDQLAKALLAGDGKAAAAVYTEDAILLPPGEPLVRGRADIEAYWAKSAAGLAEMKLTTAEVQPMGADFARELGAFAGSTKGDAPQTFSGKYVLIWKKTGDVWLATADIWNADSM